MKNQDYKKNFKFEDFIIERIQTRFYGSQSYYLNYAHQSKISKM